MSSSTSASAGRGRGRGRVARCSARVACSSGLLAGCRGGRGGDGAGGDVGEGGHAQADSAAAAGGDLVHLGELCLGAGEADLEAFGFAEPAVLFGFGDARGEVVADLDQAGSLVGVGAQQRAAKVPLTETVRGVLGAY